MRSVDAQSSLLAGAMCAILATACGPRMQPRTSALNGEVAGSSLEEHPLRAAALPKAMPPPPPALPAPAPHARAADERSSASEESLPRPRSSANRRHPAAPRSAGTPARAPAATTRDEGRLPAAAVVAMGIGGTALFAGLVAAPASETPTHGAPSPFTVVSLGVGAAGFGVAGAIVLVSRLQSPATVGLAVGPGHVAVAGGF